MSFSSHQEKVAEWGKQASQYAENISRRCTSLHANDLIGVMREDIATLRHSLMWDAGRAAFTGGRRNFSFTVTMDGKAEHTKIRVAKRW